MKKLLAYLFIVGILMQTCSKQIIFVEYLYNKNYISTVLCENKNVPAMHCLGKCHLKKELDRDTKRQDGGDQKYKPASEVIVSEFSLPQLKFTSPFIREIFYIHSSNLVDEYNPSIFHPPSSLFS